MSQVWKLTQNNYDENYFLNKLTNKDQWCKTTSRKFKEDVLRIFDDHKKLKCVEIGSCRGDTTRVLAECFERVFAFEQSDQNVDHIKQKCSDVNNVEISQADVYRKDFTIPNVDVAFIDAGHSTELVLHDINRFLSSNENMILVFDDYGQKDKSIKTAVEKSGIQISRHIGEYNGFTFERLNGDKVSLVGREGVVCNL